MGAGTSKVVMASCVDIWPIHSYTESDKSTVALPALLEQLSSGILFYLCVTWTNYILIVCYYIIILASTHFRAPTVHFHCC